MLQSQQRRYQCRVRKETGSQVLGSWKKEARADRGLYKVREAAVAAVGDCVVRALSAHTLSVLLGMQLGDFGAFRCVFILVINTRAKSTGQNKVTKLRKPQNK